jgi:hypothetical protein
LEIKNIVVIFVSENKAISDLNKFIIIRGLDETSPKIHPFFEKKQFLGNWDFLKIYIINFKFYNYDKN